MLLWNHIGLGIAISALVGLARAADDPAIQGKTREAVQKAMQTHIEQNLDQDRFVVYDGKEGVVRKLAFEKLHPGIVKNGGFYASCADFSDGKSKYDVDFLVAEHGGDYRVVEALIHKVDGEKRPYRVE